ncbi:MAG: hypothetical protein ACYC6L_16740, partial [Anaerolineae bacterium]
EADTRLELYHGERRVGSIELKAGVPAEIVSEELQLAPGANKLTMHLAADALQASVTAAHLRFDIE